MPMRKINSISGLGSLGRVVCRLSILLFGGCCSSLGGIGIGSCSGGGGSSLVCM